MKPKFNKLKILSFKEKKKIENKLEERFGIERIRGLIIRRGKERLFLYSGSLSPKQITELEENIIIERIGVYFAKLVIDGGEEKIRLSIEGAQILKDQIKKNIFLLDSKQAEEWMHGQQLDISTGKFGYMIMKHNDDFLGTGKASMDKIGNYIPKSRRLKSRGN